MNATTLYPGLRVRLCRTSPIECEGVAPGPGHAGVLVEAPAEGDARRCWGVRFEGLSLVWPIPEHLLEAVDEVAPAPRQVKGRTAHAA